jgi:hypothetical protein
MSVEIQVFEIMNTDEPKTYVAPNDMDTHPVFSVLFRNFVNINRIRKIHYSVMRVYHPTYKAYPELLLDQNHKMGTVDHRALLMDPIMAEKKEYTTRYYQLRQDCSRVRTL